MALNQSQLSHPKYRADIDGLRAIAVLSVVIFHAFPSVIRGGFIGVDIFFVISGFLISTIIFQNLENNTFSFREFYARRIKRIYPVLILVLATCLIFGWFSLLAHEYAQLGKHVAAGAGFVSNIILWGESGYFDYSADLKPLLHLWSLGVEEQFYIFWPVLLWVCWKKKLNLLTITILIGIISFYLNLRNVSTDATATFYSPLTRFWELLAGSLLAWVTLYPPRFLNHLKAGLQNLLSTIIYHNKYQAKETLLVSFVSIFAFILLVFGFWRINQESTFPGKWAILPVLSAFLLISAGPKAWVNQHILSNKIAVWFGLISFPLYLWHWPLLAFARIMEENTPNFWIRTACVLIAILLAYLSFKWIEKPLRLAKNQKVIVWTLFLISLMLGTVGYAIYQFKGIEFRQQKNAELAKIVSFPEINIESIHCKKYIKTVNLSQFDGGCHISKNQQPTILFLGDSHMAHYRSAIYNSFKDQSVLDIMVFGCVPFSADTFMNELGCKDRFDEVLKFLETDQHIKTIYLSAYWSRKIGGGSQAQGIHWRIASQPTKERTESFLNYANQFFKIATKNGRKVVFIKDIPDLTFDIESCFSIRPMRITEKKVRADCYIPSSDYQNRMQPFDNILNSLLSQYPEIQVFDPRPLFCDDKICKVIENGLPLYQNGDHLNHIGAQKVINELKIQVEKL